MVFVEGGTFQMGCTSEHSECRSDEYPVHTVTVSSFSIGKYQVTRAQWLAAMKGHATLANPGRWKDDDQLPIEEVNWYDIDTAFLPRLRALTGKQYRLPTEAEWEYAARGGKHKSTYKYSGSDDVNEVAWYESNSGDNGGNSNQRTHPVGQKKPNALGIYDMNGNVWEWCSDWYSGDYNAAIAKGNTNPKGPDAGSTRVIRGGRVHDTPIYVRTPARYGHDPNSRTFMDGLRLVLPAQ
jgi:formylglycine-generating enzyme required for sulfatase activity